MAQLGARSLRPLRAAILVGLTAVAGAVAVCFVTPAVQVYHAAERYPRRSGDFTVNITGSLAPHATHARYRLNGSSWRELASAAPRVPPPHFTIELLADELRAGPNNVEVQASRFGMMADLTSVNFEYDPAPVVLPIVEDWSGSDLDVQDGRWETFQAGGGWRVRPRPGHEGYDRMIVVTGAFAGGRRVETDLIFRASTGDGPFGFGVLPLWGGRPDADGHRPRRGWNFSLVWYYSHYDAIGEEFSYKVAAAAPEWVATYRNLELERNVRYLVVVECRSVVDAAGRHLRYDQRMKWWREGQSEPDEWMTLSDSAGAPLPEGEFCVALISHRSQVDYGPVRVLPLDSVRGDPD